MCGILRCAWVWDTPLSLPPKSLKTVWSAWPPPPNSVLCLHVSSNGNSGQMERFWHVMWPLATVSRCFGLTLEAEESFTKPRECFVFGTGAVVQQLGTPVECNWSESRIAVATSVATDPSLLTRLNDFLKVVDVKTSWPGEPGTRWRASLATTQQSVPQKNARPNERTAHFLAVLWCFAIHVQVLRSYCTRILVAVWDEL